MANGESRFDPRITTGNILTILVVAAGIIISLVRTEMQQRTDHTWMLRMEAKQDMMIANDKDQDKRITYLEAYQQIQDEWIKHGGPK